MPLNSTHIDELKKIYEQEFNEKLTDEEAWEMGISLVNLFTILLKPTDENYSTQVITKGKSRQATPLKKD